ncbi:golgin subfamily A member 3 isoform X2 [Pantherophis guttatus]|uniref:Golgin subfamily A member 3 isoform X2 n=1 Tax=Pantherophis guttatus TaxID=94885 RepID=A0ABM3YUK9_PANGU|nr:golgin subfamily A member 3 isoform X2 [Pantherophis guttatus]
MDSSVVIQEASNGAPVSSEQQPDRPEVKSKRTMEREDLNVLSVNNGGAPSEGDTVALKSSRGPCANGPTSYDPEQPVPLGPTESSLGKEPASGAPGFHEHLKASRGGSDESLALRKDTLQSLKLSLPLQETELCSADAPLPLEKEELIRLQARKRLEEQLKQYRVKRHQERLFTAKSRPSSTLDPELMWNPEILPRASPVTMTKEYSFLRTSVPRGPKVGSLGLPASLKEKKNSRSSRTSRIRSLADYRTENPDGSASGTVPVSDSSGGSLKQNSNSLTSVVSSISLTPDSDDRLETLSLAGDSVSEMDGSEAGMRLDGNESDSSTYSSVSGRGLTSSSPKSKPGMAFTINGQEVPLDAVGQFPSIREVLQAAATEQRAQEQEQEVNGEARSRRDSISSSISMESSVAGTHDELLQVLKEKMRLEGQLEALSLEANEALKEKAELQAQLAAVQMKLQTHMEHSQTSQQKQDSLNSEVATLKQSCWDLERAMAELQTTLEAKNAGLVASHNDLQLAEEQYQRLMGKVEDLQKNVLGKDSMVHDLRQQLSSLQSQLQQVELDRASLTGKLKSSQAEIASLQKVRHWYQQQLTVAQQARIRLQSDMANVKAGQMTQVGLLEHLKLENVTLSHQLTETQHRSIKEKERIAAQLQNIEADMLDQEAAFLQIQEAKSMIEDDLQRKLEEFEDEKEQLQKMADSAASLEQELEKVKLTLQQRDVQVETLQQEQLDLMRQLTSAQETLQTRDQTVGELQVRYDELEARLAELQGEAASKDDSIRYLQNEKIVLEVALQVAKAGQEGLEESIQHLGGHTEAASDVLEQLKQDVAIKSSQVENLQQESANLKKQTQKVKEQYLQQKVMVEAYRRDALSKDQLISELKSTKKKLDAEIKELRRQFLQLQGEKKSTELENSKLAKDLTQIQQQMEELESQLQLAQKERNDMEMELQSLRFDQEQMSALVKVNEDLKRQVDEMQQETKLAITEQKQKMKRLGSDLSTAQKEMKAKHKAYENAVGVLSRRLQEALAAKESSEAELNELKAQFSESENNHASLEKIRTLEAELQSLTHSKTVLEKELQEVISLTSQELEEYREKVLELEDELQEARGFRRKIKRLEEANKKLSLELEHERGKLTGLGQSNAALREHNRILEAALAKREADLVQLNLQVQAVLRSKEEEDQKMKQLIQTLQMALEKEKANVLSLKEQVTTTKAESAHNRRHYKAAALELGEVKRELQAKEVLIEALQAEVDKLQAEDGKHSEEVSQIQRELVDARSQLQLLQKQLDDQLDKQPVENQELEDLKWEVEQKERELQTLKQQLDLTEQRSQKELEGVQLVLQNLKTELEMVRDDLSITQKDKFMLQAKMSELKNSIKTLLQQNQQLKLDLKQGKMKKKLKGETSSNPVTPVKIPDCPVPAALLEELLKPSSAVSKEPLRNLNSCLQQLRQEMDSLQRQMEEHTVTVHESMSSWTQIEGQWTDLTSNLSVTLLSNESLPHRDLQDHKPSTDAEEELAQ